MVYVPIYLSSSHTPASGAVPAQQGFHKHCVTGSLSRVLCSNSDWSSTQDPPKQVKREMRAQGDMSSDPEAGVVQV